MNRLMACFVVAGMMGPGLGGCGAAPGPAGLPAMQGATFSLSGPACLSKAGTPSVIFTTVNRQDGSREFVYFLIVKPPAPRNGMAQQTSSSEANSSGLNGVAKAKLTINGKDLNLDYKMTVRADGSLESETFEINGKRHAFDKGRVFLVDLSVEPIGIVAHDVKLATPNAGLTNPTEFERQAENTIKELEQDPAVGEFLQSLR